MTALTPPTQQTVANIYSELQRLGIPMDGWWHEPVGTIAEPEPFYGMRVHSESLRDWDADWMTFNWDDRHGWTMDSQCAPGPIGSPAVLDILNPHDVAAVARHFKAVIDGEIDEFRSAA